MTYKDHTMDLKTRQAWKPKLEQTLFSNVLVIYHAGCPDGTCAAACALVAYPEAECVPANYGDPPPDVSGRDVIVVDFSYPRATLEAMAESARSLRVLDHHKTAVEGLDGFLGATFDMQRSGAGLAWDELVGGKRPWLVDYVEDADLWRWALPDSRAVRAWIGTLPLDDPRAWGSRIVATGLGQPVQLFPQDITPLGEAILDFQTRYVEQVAAQAERGVIGRRDVPVVNAAYPMGSTVLETLDKGEWFAARWNRRADGLYQYSLRSEPDGLDVAEIAKTYGGGGHEHAAGFVSDRLVHVRDGSKDPGEESSE